MIFSLLLISYGVFQGIFLSLFFFKAKKIEKAQKLISIFLILTILILCLDYVLSNYFILYTEEAFVGIGWSSSCWLLIVPLYYLLLYSFLTGKKLKFIKIFPHFLPFLVSLCYNLPFFILPAEVRRDYLLSYSSGSNITVLHIISKGVYHAQLLVYPLLILRLVKIKRVSVFNFVSIVNFCLLVLGIGTFTHLLAFNIFGLSISWFTSSFIFISLTFFIHLTAYTLMIRPNWMYRHIDEVLLKYSNSNLINVDLERIQNDLEILMNQEKIYLEQDLSLSKLAKLLTITPHQLSEFLNHKNSESFHNYVNFHRIEEAKTLLIDPVNSMFTIEAIAEQVGFKSAATFYRSFKKHTGFSPTKWIQNEQMNS